MNILKNILIWKRTAFPEILFPQCDTYPWVVSISSFVWLMIILRFQFFCSIYTVWNFENYACYFVIWPNHKYILPGAISNYHWFQSSLNLFRRDGIIWFNSLLIVNNPPWTINRHFFCICVHLFCFYTWYVLIGLIEPPSSTDDDEFQIFSLLHIKTILTIMYLTCL